MLIGEVDSQGRRSEHREDAFATRNVQGSDVLMDEIRSFVSAVEHGHEPWVTGEDGMKALEIAIEVSRKIYESSDTEKPIRA